VSFFRGVVVVIVFVDNQNPKMVGPKPDILVIDPAVTGPKPDILVSQHHWQHKLNAFVLPAIKNAFGILNQADGLKDMDIHTD
jgi:hypothetical protein